VGIRRQRLGLALTYVRYVEMAEDGGLLLGGGREGVGQKDGLLKDWDGMGGGYLFVLRLRL